MFLRRKLLRVTILLFAITILIISFSYNVKIVNEDAEKYMKQKFQQFGGKLNYFDGLYRKYFRQSYDFGDDAVFDKDANELLSKKLRDDPEDKFWVIRDLFDEYMTLNIPNYYINSASQTSNLKKDQNDMKDPEQDALQDTSKPVIQPFDPRFTLGMYYHYIKQVLKNANDGDIPEIPFHWDDWVDLSRLHKYILAPSTERADCSLLDARGSDKDKREDDGEDEEGKPRLEKRGSAVDPKQYCLNDNELPNDFNDGNAVRPGFNVFKAPAKITEEIALTTGKSYLYSFAPNPFSIIFLTKDGSYNMPVRRNSREKLLDSNIVEEYIRDSGKSEINVLEEFKSLQKTIPSDKKSVINDYQIHLSPDDFSVDSDTVITNLEQARSLGLNEKNYLESLKYSQDRVKNGGPPKYFSESRLLGTLLGDHFDWRFFNGVHYASYEHTLTLHHLVRTFLSFCRNNGLNTWVAHGSLLSWYWNGLGFPWDNDIDVQMPIKDLHKLSREFNQTLIVEDVEDGFGRYLLDCGSFITLREKGNGNNNIDVRFIDLDTGLYIDVTGLALSNSKPPDRYTGILPTSHKIEESTYKHTNELLQIYNCRNNHFSKLSELSPLVKSTIEGEIGYIPNRFTAVLDEEYKKGTLSKKFSRHVFVQQLRLWLKESDVYEFLKDREAWNSAHKPQIEEEFLEEEAKDGFGMESNDESKEQPQGESQEQVEGEAKEEPKKEPQEEQNSNEESNESEDESKDSKLDKREDKKLDDKQLKKLLNYARSDLFDLLYKSEILINYITTKDFTRFHEKELMHLLDDNSTEPLISSISKFRPMKVDNFLYKVHRNDINYDDEVKKLMELISTYNN